MRSIIDCVGWYGCLRSRREKRPRRLRASYQKISDKGALRFFGITRSTIARNGGRMPSPAADHQGGDTNAALKYYNNIDSSKNE